LYKKAAASVTDFYDSYPFPGRLGSYGAWESLAPTLLQHVQVPDRFLLGAKVLDAGCGTGEYSRSLANAGAHVTAIDISANAIQVARDLDRNLNVTGIEYKQQDILAFRPHGSFDLVVSLGVLHHTTDPEAGFFNLASAVRADGYLVIGLYSSISRIHILALRQALRVLSLGNRERALNIAMKWLRPLLPFFVGSQAAHDRARVADLLVHPHERPVGLDKALLWCQRAGLVAVAGSPSFEPRDYFVTRKFFRSPNRIASLLIQFRWLLWNADYYVISARRPS
jgi:SAM-dependent methyltransferase